MVLVHGNPPGVRPLHGIVVMQEGGVVVVVQFSLRPLGPEYSSTREYSNPMPRQYLTPLIDLMESVAIVVSLLVAAAVVMITYIYASGQTPPSVNSIIVWVVSTFQRGLNVVSSMLGTEPLFPAVRQIGASAAPVVKGAAGGIEAGARTVQQVVASAEQAVVDTVTPGGAAPGTIGLGGLDAAVDGGLGFCYVGQGPGGRTCAQVSRESECMSGEYFSNRQECTLNSGARLGARPSHPGKHGRKGSWETNIGSLL